MNNNEILARWQGTIRRQDGNAYALYPDYFNDDVAAMSLLDTLVEKEYYPELFYCLGHKWNCTISDDGDLVVQGRGATRPAAVCAAVLEMIERETLSGKEYA